MLLLTHVRIHIVRRTVVRYVRYGTVQLVRIKNEFPEGGSCVSAFARAFSLPMMLFLYNSRNFGQERTILNWPGVHGGLKRAYSEGHTLLV